MAKTPTGWTDADGNPTYIEDQPARKREYSIATPAEGVIPEVPKAAPYNKAEPSIGETVAAYYRQNNWLGSAIADKTRGVNQRWDGEFDSDSAMLKNPDLNAYKDKLGTAKNQAHFDAMAEQIRMELTDKDTIERTEGFIPNAVGIVGSALDPSLVIPGTAIVKGAKTVGTVAKTVGASAAIGAATGFGQGSVLDATQLTGDGHAARDYAAFGAAGGALFGGWVGMRAAAKMTQQQKDDALRALVESQRTLPTSGNAGAMRVDRNIIPDGERLPVIEGAVKVREASIDSLGKEGTGLMRTPNLELATSNSTAVRQTAQDIGNNALMTEKNLHGVATPQSLELAIRQTQHVLAGKLASTMEQEFKSFVQGFAKMDFAAISTELKNAGRNVTADEVQAIANGTFNKGKKREIFNELVAASTRNGDTSAIGEVGRAAQGSRNIIKQLGDEANSLGLFEAVHKKAEREALTAAKTTSPAAKIASAAIEQHAAQVIEKQASQLLRLKDKLYELKTLGRENGKAATRLKDAITRAEANLNKKDGGEAVKKVHQEFADAVKAMGNVTDTAARKAIAQKMFDAKRIAARDADLTRKAAKSNLEAFAEQAAKDARTASEQLIPKTAQSYLPRMWDVEKLIQNEQEFKNIVVTHYAGKGLDPDEAKLLADDLFEKMKNTQQGLDKSPTLASPTSFASLSARTLDIPDNTIGKFLINDADYVTNQYIQDMTKAIEYHKRFGGRSISEVFDEDIGQSYKAMRDEVYARGLPKDEELKLITEIESNYRSDKSNLTHLYNTVMGKANDVDGLSASTSKIIKVWTNMTSLGMIVAASIPDLGRVVSVAGFGKPLKAIAAMMNKEFRNLTVEEAEHFGYGFERLLGTRSHELFDIGSNASHTRPGPVEGMMNSANGRFHDFTGFNRWNSMMKHFAGLMHADKSMKAILDYDNMDVGTKAYLAQAGIDKDMATRIAEQYGKFGVDEKSFKFGNTSLWDDQVAKETYQRAIFKLTNHTIMTPDAGTVPTYFKSKWWSLVTQFMSFNAAGEEQMIAAGLQRHSSNEVKGLLTMIGAGIAVSIGKDRISQATNEDYQEKEIEELIFKGIDATGIFGVASVVNQKLHDAGNLGVQDFYQRFVNDEEVKRVEMKNVVGAALGAGPNKLIKTVTALENIANGNNDEKARSDLWKAVPGNNIHAVKWLGDIYGPAINASFGE